MNVMIIGRNEINGELAARIEGRGYAAFVVEDAGRVKGVQGESGCFKVRLGPGQAGAGAEEMDAAAVIVTEGTGKAVPDVVGGQPVPLFDAAAIKGISGANTKGPVVFLLDYFNESPMASTVRALEEATALARRKCNVAYVFRFMRSAGLAHERLYKAARNAGVTFFKYEALHIRHDSEIGAFAIEASDGVNQVEISTKHVISDSGYGVGDGFAGLAAKLRLKVNPAGYINEDRYMLNPTRTSRKGVYFINADAAADRLVEGIDYTLSAIEADLDALALYAAADCDCVAYVDKNHAVVDGEKCVFCYTCYRACPHAAMAPDEEARVMMNNNVACEACGACAAVCPGNAVTLLDDDFCEEDLAGKRGKMKIFCCENSGDIALREVLPALGELASRIDVETVPCGGRIGFEQLSGALRSYQKTIALVCMDDACKHFDGNKRACKQAERLAAMLDSVGADKDRVGFLQTSHAMAHVLKDNLKDFFVQEGLA